MIYEIQHISFSYPSSGKRVLDGLSLVVREGDIVSILGRNGAGKSTLMHCMLGLLKPQSGALLLGGRDIGKMSEREIATIAGYVPQTHTPSFGYSVMDFVLMGCAPRIGLFARPGRREREDAERSIRELGIESIADHPYTEISGGERQKATIARAIVLKPRVILFDEPTAYLDYGSQLLVLRMIKALSQKGYSVVITTHNPDHALLLGGKAALLNESGSMVVGATEEVITQENLSRIYQVDVRLEYVQNLGRMACVFSNL